MLFVVSFKIATIYVFIVKLLSKRIVSIASNSDAKLLNKTFKSLLIIVTIASKVNFYMSKTIYQIY